MSHHRGIGPCGIAGGLGPAASQGDMESSRVQKSDSDLLHKEYCVLNHGHHRLGAGADGAVLRGIHLVTQEWHALKFVSRGCYRGSEQAQEYEILRKFKHPHVVQVLGWYPAIGTRVNGVMTMLEADMTLLHFLGRARVNQHHRLTPALVQSLVAQLLSATQHIHALSWMHRDIKPNNILVYFAALRDDDPSSTAGGMKPTLWLADFSRARHFRKENEPQRPDKADLADPQGENANNTCGVGCEAYAAPEVLSLKRCKEVGYDSRVDIWSLGAVFFELLMLDRLVPPALSTHQAKVLQALSQRLGTIPARFLAETSGLSQRPGPSPIPPLATYNVNTLSWPHKHAVVILQRCLAWEPRDRPSAQALGEIFGMAVGDSEGRPANPRGEYSGQKSTSSQPASAPSAASKAPRPLSPGVICPSSTAGGVGPTRGAPVELGYLLGKLKQGAAKLIPVSCLSLLRAPTAAKQIEDGEQCACSGNCLKRHQHGKCKHMAAAGSTLRLCLHCSCTICDRPQNRSEFCVGHARAWALAVPELHLAKLAREHVDWAWFPDQLVTFLEFATEFFNDLTMLIVFGLTQVHSVVKTFAMRCALGAPQGERLAQLTAVVMHLLRGASDNPRLRYRRKRARRAKDYEIDSQCERLLKEWQGSAPSNTAGGGQNSGRPSPASPALERIAEACHDQSKEWLELLSPAVPAESVPKRIQRILKSIPGVPPVRLKWMQLQLMLTVQVARSIEWSLTDLGVDDLDLFGGWGEPMALPGWRPSDFSAALFGRRDWCLLVPVLLEMWRNALGRCGVKAEELVATFVDEKFGGQRDKVMAYLRSGLTAKLRL